MKTMLFLGVLSGLMGSFLSAAFAGEPEPSRPGFRETGERVAAALFGSLGETLQQISPSVLAAIRKIYPEDQAVDFREGDLRGAVVVTFKAPGAIR